MTKKIFICVSLCVVLFSIVGCAKITSPLPIDDASTVSSTQSTNGSLTNSSTPTQSTGDSSELSPTQSTTGTSTNSSTPTQSTGDSSELSPTQSTTGTSTTSSTPTQSEKPTNSGDDNMDDTYKLIVKGKEIATTNHIKLNYEYHYAELPLTAIMKELGAKVEWQCKTTAKITFDEKDYLLDTQKGSLVEAGNTFNVLVAAPGSKHGVFYRVVDNEFIIDSDSAKMLLINIMGTKISIDYDNRIVNIS